MLQNNPPLLQGVTIILGRVIVHQLPWEQNVRLCPSMQHLATQAKHSMQHLATQTELAMQPLQPRPNILCTFCNPDRTFYALFATQAKHFMQHLAAQATKQSMQPLQPR